MRKNILTKPVIMVFLCLFYVVYMADYANAKELVFPVTVNVDDNIEKLIGSVDTDGDKKITVDDNKLLKGEVLDPVYSLKTIDGTSYDIEGVYPLSNLLMLLTLARDEGKKASLISPDLIYENPVSRTSRLIRDLYWDGLTRRIDAENLVNILLDDKMQTRGLNYLYVPYSDNFAYDYFSAASKDIPVLNLSVSMLPNNITPEYVKNLEDKHGLLVLALKNENDKTEGVPFVVPGGRFNEMYGWDSYFITLGLIEDERLSLAKSIVDNFVYEINHYGKILNANRSYFLNRSQPPFLTSMILSVYSKLPKTRENKDWLHTVLNAAIKEYNEVWTNKERMTPIGLSRYYGSGLGVPPEVEPGHFDAIFIPYAVKYEMDSDVFENKYKMGEINEPELDNFFMHDRCVRESGHDTTYRWYVEGKESCADFVTIDLNALLYKTEIDIANIIEKEFDNSFINMVGDKETSDKWYAVANKRKILINKYLWNDDKGMFYDYNYVRKQSSDYVTATTFYPLWASYRKDPSTMLISYTMAEKLLSSSFQQLEMPGGLSSTSETSSGTVTLERPQRQWDYPHGWAPHQMVAWQGLINYGYEKDAYRLIYKWLYTITKNAANYNATVPEKFDVVNRSHKVYAEYGNVGTEFEYITKEGFGWMNASYQVGLSLLPENLIEKLSDLVPPEEIFK